MLLETRASQPTPQGVAVQTETIRRPRRVAKKTYDTERTVFTRQSRQFGQTLLRKDWGTDLDLTPRERLDFIRACVRYARTKGRIELLLDQLGEYEKNIRRTTDAHEGLRGIESERLDVSVTDVSQVDINPDPVAIRKRVGSAFPQFGTEKVTAAVTVPEEDDAPTADQIEEFFRLALRFLKLSDETISTNVVFDRTMKVTDREALFNAVNQGLVPEDALRAKKSKRVEVKRLHQAPGPK